MEAPQDAEEIVADPPAPTLRPLVAGDDVLFAGKKIFWIPLVPLIALDLWSKSWAFQFVSSEWKGFNPANRVEMFDWPFLQLEFVTWLNRGTIWGLGDEFHDYLKYLRVGAIALILYFVFKTPAKARWMLLSLSLILSGAIGNLYDNFFHFDAAYSKKPQFAGAVRDFLHFHNGESWDFPAFNIADSCISVGACALFVLLWFAPHPEKGSAEAKNGEDALDASRGKGD